MRLKYAVISVALTLGMVGASYAEPQRGGTIKSRTSGYRTLNPAVQSGATTGTPGAQLFAGLVRIDKDFQPQSYLAESWEVQDNGLTYVFHLRDGAFFHDGEPITSADIAFSLNAVKENHPFGMAMFGKVEAVDTPDSLTAVIRLKEPTPGLMLSLAPLLMPVLPKHIYDDGQDLKTHPRNMEDVVGSGPFVLTENTPSERLVLSRNENFFIEGRPYVDRITFPLVKDALTTMLMLENGELNLVAVSGARPQDAKRFERNPDVEITTDGYGAIGSVVYLEMNLREKPFNDIRVREAMAYAIDTEFIANVLFSGQAKVGTGPLHSGNPFYSADVPRYNIDLDKAAALLDEAGLKPDSNGERFAFTLDVPNWSLDTHGPISQYLRPQLAKIGVKVELRRAPDFGTWVSRVSSFDYQATMNAAYNYPDPTIGVERLYRCDNIRNVIWANTQGYCNEDVDRILHEASQEVDDERRKALYAEFQRKIVEDVVFVFMPEQFITTGYRTELKNVPVAAFGPIGPWDEIYLEDK